MRHVVLLLALSILLVNHGGAQAFDAVSLHPLAPGAKPENEAALAALDPSTPATDPAPGLLSADLNVFEMIVFAYKIRDSGLQPALQKQLPAWAEADEYHLTARLPTGATVGQMRLMLQTLLKERFALASHEEIRPLPVFLLAVDPKQALKLTTHTQPCSKEMPCGSHAAGANGALQVTFAGQTLDEIAQELGGYAWYWAGLHYGPVVNATSLQGRYDGTFTFTPIFKADAQTVTTLPYALRHDLGLMLQKGIRPITQRIIDHVEHPSFD